MNYIDFTIPLSHSKLFDTHVILTAKKLCEKFSNLQYDTVKNEEFGKFQKPEAIRISGTLNDNEYSEWCRIVFETGRFEV